MKEIDDKETSKIVSKDTESTIQMEEQQVNETSAKDASPQARTTTRVRKPIIRV